MLGLLSVSWKVAAVLFVIICAVNADQLWRLIQKTPYAWEYNISEANVTYSPRPSDCDFFGSPVGFKSCHYEKQVQVYDDHGRPIVNGYVVDGRGERVGRGKADRVTVEWSKINDCGSLTCD
jgi:hypothetical protein